MPGDGPYLWINTYAPAAGFHRVPPGGMCIGVFLFVRRGDRLLLGKWGEHKAWEALAGEDAGRVKSDSGRWKIPARQLKLGEDPREAARQVGEAMLVLPGMGYSEPRVEVEFWRLGDQASGPPERRELFHYDMWMMVDATLAEDQKVGAPPWFDALAFVSPDTLAPAEWARFHDDVYARWKRPRPSQ